MRFYDIEVSIKYVTIIKDSKVFSLSIFFVAWIMLHLSDIPIKYK